MTTVVRFSSLGDVVLAGSLCPALAPVTFVTLERYAPLVRHFQGVEAVLTPSQGLAALRRALPPGPVVDLHGSLRSRVLPADRRVRSHRLARWARVAWKHSSPVPTVLQRYAEAAGVQPSRAPWCGLPAHRGGALGVAAGGSAATKVWPHFAELAASWSGPVLSLGLPGEEVAGAEPCTERGFDATLAALARCRLFVGGDTGLTHLAHACGLPTLMLMGPTHADDGFWSGPQLGLELSCRPCSRHGGPVCPLGDHACLRDLTVEAVLRSLNELS